MQYILEISSLPREAEITANIKGQADKVVQFDENGKTSKGYKAGDVIQVTKVTAKGYKPFNKPWEHTIKIETVGNENQRSDIKLEKNEVIPNA